MDSGHLGEIFFQNPRLPENVDSEGQKNQSQSDAVTGTYHIWQVWQCSGQFRDDKFYFSFSFDPIDNTSSHFVPLIKRIILAKGIGFWVKSLLPIWVVQKWW